MSYYLLKSGLIHAASLAASGLLLASLWFLFRSDNEKRSQLLGASGIVLALLGSLLNSGSMSWIILARPAAGAIAAFQLLRNWKTDSTIPSIALLTVTMSLSGVLVMGGHLRFMSNILNQFAMAQLEMTKGLPAQIQRDVIAANPAPETSGFPSAIFTVLASFIGGLVASGGTICYLKSSRSELRKSLPKFEDPAPIRYGLLFTCGLIAVMMQVWPLIQFWYWFMLIAAAALGYVLTIHLKIVDVPLVVAGLVSGAGLNVVITGLISGDHVVVMAGGIVFAGAAVITRELSQQMDVSLLGLLRGTETSKKPSVTSQEPAAEGFENSSPA